jgi:steroid delta-isomerase-like uncharacterized protein
MSPDRTPEENKAIMADYIEHFWNQNDAESSARFVADDVTLHGIDADVPTPLAPGREGLMDMRRMFDTAMPDFKMAIDHMIAEDDMVLLHWTGSGTHTGDFFGVPATHRTANWTAMSLTRMKDGKMVEGWQTMDNMGLMQQLGVLPKGSPPAPMRLFLTLRGRRQARKNKRQGG